MLDDDQPWRRVLQHALSWWWLKVSDGCHCDRRTLPRIKGVFGERNVVNWTMYAGSFAWTARFELGVAINK